MSDIEKTPKRYRWLMPAIEIALALIIIGLLVAFWLPWWIGADPETIRK
jgi:hypothetical protein